MVDDQQMLNHESNALPICLELQKLKVNFNNSYSDFSIQIIGKNGRKLTSSACMSFSNWIEFGSTWLMTHSALLLKQ